MLDATIFVASAASLSVVLTIVIFIVSITWRREAKAAAKHQLVAKLTEQYIPLHAFVRKMRILLWWRENLAVNSGMHSRFAPFVRGTFRTVREHAKALALDQIPSRDEDATGAIATSLIQTAVVLLSYTCPLHSESSLSLEGGQKD